MKIFICGYCGNLTDEGGEPLSGKDFIESANYLELHGDSEAEQVQGNCCAYQEEHKHYMEVTREMALDCGCPEMEGTLIRWD